MVFGNSHKPFGRSGQTRVVAILLLIIPNTLLVLLSTSCKYTKANPLHDGGKTSSYHEDYNGVT